jgi:pimeloyl-ACP methyl ester carboxylesterase
MAGQAPLLLLSGLLSDGALWQAQAADLADMAGPVIPDLSRDETIAGMARRTLAAAPPHFAVAGLSMGGYVALEIMRAAPERVTGLALLGTSARTDTPEQAERRREAIRLAEEGGFEGVADQMLPYLVHPERLADPAIVSAIRAMAERLDRDGFLRKQRAIMGRTDSRPQLSRIACPTLVLCGREDASAPLPLSEEIAALVPDARLCVLERCGHMSPMERPAEVTAALRRWLSEGCCGGPVDGRRA